MTIRNTLVCLWFRIAVRALKRSKVVFCFVGCTYVYPTIPKGKRSNHMATSSKTTKRQPVVVTTEHRGVFFGYLLEDKSPDRVILEDARMCVYWSAKVHGVLGLAATGPDKDSRVGPKT